MAFPRRRKPPVLLTFVAGKVLFFTVAFGIPLMLHAAWRMDTEGKKEAWPEISMAKVLCAQTACRVVDRAIQVHGALGVTDDVPLAAMYRYARILRLGDGADEVHKVKISEHEMRRWT